MRREHAAVHQLLCQGVVGGELFERNVTLQVAAAVAQVNDVHPRPRHVGHGQDDAHLWHRPPRRRPRAVLTHLVSHGTGSAGSPFFCKMPVRTKLSRRSA
jgi:hypothetical protein